MVRHADPDGLATRIEQASRHLASRPEHECVRPRRGALEQAVLPVVDDGEPCNLGKVAADDREEVVLARLAERLDALHRAFRPYGAAECVTGVRRVRDDAT